MISNQLAKASLFPIRIFRFYYFQIDSTISNNFSTKTKSKNLMSNRNKNNILCIAEKHDAAKNIAKFLSNGTMQQTRGNGQYIYNFTFSREYTEKIE